MQVVGYVREAPRPDDGESAYAQSERIRRWVARGGHSLVAVCQDVPQPGHALERQGYRALLGIVEAGQADAVLLPGLAALSVDKIVQEVMLWDLRRRGVLVLVTEEEDLAALADPSEDPARMLVRDVLARTGEYAQVLEGVEPVARGEPEVIVELVPWQEEAG
ncbi:MAG: recombinase family protein [Actinomycetota bacterium]|nr:recombinase family protein [Actinomycetota bacterium]